MKLRYLIHLLPALLVLPAAFLHAQSLTLYNIDASQYPSLSANIVAVDAAGNPLRNFSPNDLAITENGAAVTNVVIDCPAVKSERPFAAVLVNDRSGSMNLPVASGLTRLQLLRKGVNAFLGLVHFAPPTQVALTAFDQDAYIVSDFKSSAPPLIAVMDSLTANGGTQYNPAFLDPLAGGISLLKARKDTIRRVLVFLTDGLSNVPTDAAAIIQQAQAAHVQVYAITIGMPMNDDLRAIVEATGGAWFENVVQEKQIEAIYQQIALESRGVEPCTVHWQSAPMCGQNNTHREVKAQLLSQNASSTGSYEAPAQSVLGLEASPNYLYFGTIAPPNTLSLPLTITARNGSMTVNKGTISLPQFSILDWGGTPPPFTLRDGESRTLHIQFAPTAGYPATAQLALVTLPCDPLLITLTGGLQGPEPSALELLSPIGGESYSECDSVHISWGGVPPTTPITIEYSSDAGVRWNSIAKSATGLAYTWLPPSPGNGYRIRISIATSEQNIISKTAGDGFANLDSILATDAILLSPTGVAVQGDSIYIAESGANRVRVINVRNGVITVLAGTGYPGYNSATLARNAHLYNPNHLVVAGDLLYVADYGNHRIRQINLRTGTITSIAGTGASGYSGDGGLATDAQLQYPAYLALRGNDLYVSEPGNARVRHIDLLTNRISTVAGGGSNPLGENVPALSVQLNGVAGLALINDTLFIAESDAHRIRRVNLANGMIETAFGTGASGTSGDGADATQAQFKTPVGLMISGFDLYVADSAAQRIRRINLASKIISPFAGTGQAGYSGDGGPARLAKLYAPGQGVISGSSLYYPEIRSNVVRQITLSRYGGADSSGSFTVNVAHVRAGASLSAHTSDFGDLALGAVRDSAIAGAICNTGGIPLRLDTIIITGANANEFQVVSGLTSADIPPGGCVPVEFRFRPSATGIRTAIAIISGRCANSDTIYLRGNGVPACTISIAGVINLGGVAVGSQRDSILSTAICNTGSQPVSGTVTLANGAGIFTLIDGGGNYQLAPGACRTVTVRFFPKIAGRASAEIDYGVPSACGNTRTPVFATGAVPQTPSAEDTLVFSSLLCPGSFADTSVHITNPGAAPITITYAAFPQNNEGFSMISQPPTATAGIVIPPGMTDSTSVRLRFNPATPGDKVGRLELRTSNSTITVFLRGHKDSLGITSIAGSVVFQGVNSGTVPYDTSLVIHNTGTRQLTLISAQIAGTGKNAFAVPPGQFPLIVAANDSVSITVRALQKSTGASLHADVQIAYSPFCDSSTIDIPLVIPGTGPDIFAPALQFPTLVCATEQSADSVVTVQNTGGADLIISGAGIQNDAEGNFMLLTQFPVTIPPGSSATIAIRFAPKSAGAKTAVVALVSNSTAGTTNVQLSGTREAISMSAAPTGIVFTPTSSDTLLRVINTGTATITVSLSQPAVPFTASLLGNATIAPGNTTLLNIHVTGNPFGNFIDTLVITESRCGTSVRVPIQFSYRQQMQAEVRLPRDTALPGEEVSLPITIATDNGDSAAFRDGNLHAYTATVLFHATVLMVDATTGATITANTFDPVSMTQKISISGIYPGKGDTMALLNGIALLGDTNSTALSFESFQWTEPMLAATTSNGSLTIIGSCTQTPIKIAVAPKILKIAPNPVSGSATISIEAGEWQTLRATLVNALGTEESVLMDGMLPAGVHQLAFDTSKLNSGVYSLVLQTPFARVTQRVVVVK